MVSKSSNTPEYKTFFELNPQPLILFDSKSLKILDANKSALKLYKYNKKEFLTYTISKLNGDKIKQKLSDIYSGKFRTLKNVTHLNKDGNKIKVEINFTDVNYLGLNCKLLQISDISDKIINEEKFKKLAEATTEAVIISENGLILEVNQAFCKMFGYKKSECFQKNILFFAAPESSDYILNIINTGTEKIYKAHGLTKKGKKIKCELKASIIDYIGRKLRVTCIRDITEESITQQKLQETVSDYKLITETTSYIFFKATFTPQLRYTYLSSSLKKILGYQPKELINNPTLSYEILHPGDRKKQLNQSNLFVNKESLISQYRCLHKKGNYVWIETVYSPNFDKSGKLIGLTGVSRDISLLKNKESRLNFLSNLTNEGVIISSNGKLKDANNIALQILGTNQLENLINKNILDFVHPEDKPIIKKNLNNEIKQPILFKIVDLKGKIKEIESTAKYIFIDGQRQRVSVFRDVTKQIDLANRLKENERFLDSIVGNINGIIYRCANDKNWTMQYLNKPVKTLTGFSDKEILSKKVTYNELIIKEHRKRVWNEVQEALRNKAKFNLVYQIKRKNNSIIWVWEQGHPVYNERGKLVGLEGYIVNINDQKTIEEELIKSKRAFKDLVDNSPNGIIIHHKGIIEYVNDSVLKLVEQKTDKRLIGLNVLELVSNPYKKEVAKRISKAINGNELPFFEFDMMLPSGKIKRIETKANPIYFNDKPCVQVVVHDLTQKKLIESERLRAEIAEETNKLLFKEIAQRKKIEDKLISTQMFSSNLIESSLDVIMASDQKGYITEVNKAASEVFGYKQEELLGKKADILFTDKKRQEEIKKHLFEKGYYKGEVINVHKSGRQFICNLSASVIKNHKGEIVGTMGVSRDITEQKRAELLLKQSEENYRSLFNKAYIGFAKLSLSGKILEANERFCNILGLNPNNLIEIYTNQLIAKDELVHALDIRKKLLKGEINNHSDELIFIHTGGSEVIAQVTSSVSRDSENKADYFIVLLEDITQKKKNEEKVFLQAAKLNAVFESSSHVIWTVNRNNMLTSFNSNFSEIVHKHFNKIIDPFKTKLNELIISNQQQLQLWTQAYREAFKGNTQQLEFYLNDTSGNPHWYEIHLYPIFSLKLEVFEVSALGNDITDRKISEQQIANQAAKLKSIIESSSHLIFTLNDKSVITSCNENYRKKILENADIEIVTGKTTLFEILNKLSINNSQWKQGLLDAFKGKSTNFEYVLLDKKGNTLWREVYIEPIIGASGIIKEVSVIAHDITEKKKAIVNSLVQAAHIKAIFQNSSLMIFTLDRDYVLKSFNDNYFRFVKNHTGMETYVGNDLKKGFFKKNLPEEYEKLIQYHQEALAGKSITFENRLNNRDGSFTWFENHLDPIILPNGVIEEVTYITRDVTEKKAAEEKLIHSALEKEVLLKEVHHRVKNNLQVISSILSLQSTYTKDPSVLSIVRESQNRIKSMSFIHETLYQTKNFSSINFSNYLRNIVTNLVHTYKISNNKILINFEMDEVELSLDASIPCGLIFNELISNALKYAFNGMKKGALNIGLREKNHQVTLYVKDNGVGLPKNIDVFNTDSLGLQLVSALTGQLDGKLDFKSEEGTNFIITFKNKLKIT
jgi:PAS domain S-box-containing protein